MVFVMMYDILLVFGPFKFKPLNFHFMLALCVFIFQTDNPNKFGNSYVDVSYANTNPQCNFDCNQPPPPSEPCTGMDRQLAEYYCKRVFDYNGKFRVRS